MTIFQGFFFTKTTTTTHLRPKSVHILHIRNVKKVWKSDKNKKLPKIKALILLKFSCLVKDSCPNCHPLPVFIFHLSVRHLKSCGDFKWRVHGATFLRFKRLNLERSWSYLTRKLKSVRRQHFQFFFKGSRN